MRRSGQVLSNLLLVGASMLFAVLCGEAALSLFLPQIFDVHPRGMYIEDPDVGYRLTPGFSGTIERSEFRQRFRIDEAGLRAQGQPRTDGQDTVRILVLGDSQAFGFGVADDETFSAQLEHSLATRHPALRVRVMNGGVPGYGTADQLAFLKSMGPKFDPDLIIVQFLSVNDILETRTPAKDWAAVADGWLTNKAALVPEPEAETDNDGYGALAHLMFWAKAQSHLLRLTSNGLGYAALRLGLTADIDVLWGEDFPDDAAAATTDSLVAIATEARRLGAQCVFLYTTGQNYVLAEDYSSPRSAMVVRRAAESADVPWVDATPYLRGRDDRLEQFNPLDGHWTAMGHRAIAELLAERLMALRFLPIHAQ